MEAIFPQNSPLKRILETSIRQKNSVKGPTLSSKIPERVDIDTIKWHTPLRKYDESPPRVAPVWTTILKIRVIFVHRTLTEHALC